METGDPNFPYKVVTSQYQALMAGHLNAGVGDNLLWCMQVQGYNLCYAPESIAYIDHEMNVDMIADLSDVPCVAEGDTVTFTHPLYVVKYRAYIDKLKLTITLNERLREPNSALVNPETALLALTGGVLLPFELDVRDRYGVVREGDWSTVGEIYLYDPTTQQPVQYMERMTAVDANGFPGHGVLQIETDVDGMRRLYQGIPWSWLRVAEYPVTIDPTVVTTSTSAMGGRSLAVKASYVARSGNTVVTGFTVGDNLQIWRSVDGGLSWGTGAVATFSALSLDHKITWYSVTYHNGRLHLLYNQVPKDGTRTNQLVHKYSTNDGTSWSSGTAIVNESALANYVTYAKIVPVTENGADYLWLAGHQSVSYTIFSYSTNNGATWATVTKRTLGLDAGSLTAMDAIYADGQYWLTWNNTNTGTGWKLARAGNPTFSSHTMDMDDTGGADTTSTAFVRDGTTLWAFLNIGGTSRAVFKRLSGGTWTLQTASGTPTYTADFTAWMTESGVVDIAYASSGIKRQRFTLSPLTFAAATTIDSDTTVSAVGGGTSDTTTVRDVTYNRKSSSPYEVVVHSFSYNTAPTAPTGLAPNSTGRDATATITLTATAHDDAGDYPTDAQWELTDGFTTWYAKADSTLTTTPTWVATGGGTFSLSRQINGGQLANGKTIQWRVKTKDQAGAESPFSSYVQFTTTAAPVTSIVSPTNGATVATSQITVSVSVSGSLGTVTYRLYADNAGAKGTLLAEHSGVQSTIKTIEYNIVNNTSYHVAALAVSTDNVVGAEVSVLVTASFTAVATPTLTVTSDNTNGCNNVEWVSPTPSGGQPECSYVDIYRKEGNGSYIRIAKNQPASGSYADYNVTSGKTYTYKVRAVGANQTTADSAEATGGVTFTAGLWLHGVSDPQGTVHYFNWREQVKDEPAHAASDFEFAGRTHPVTQYDATMGKRVISVRIALADETTDRTALEELFYARDTLCLRDFRGRKVFVSMKTMPVSDEKFGGFADCVFDTVHYNEAV